MQRPEDGIKRCKWIEWGSRATLADTLRPGLVALWRKQKFECLVHSKSAAHSRIHPDLHQGKKEAHKKSFKKSASKRAKNVCAELEAGKKCVCGIGGREKKPVCGTGGIKKPLSVGLKSEVLSWGGLLRGGSTIQHW